MTTFQPDYPQFQNPSLRQRFREYRARRSGALHVGLVALPPFGELVMAKYMTHSRNRCVGAACPFHRPSDHLMRGWPIIMRLDKHALVERVCEHGVGHPDPDSLGYLNAFFPDLGIDHACDGCPSLPPTSDTKGPMN